MDNSTHYIPRRSVLYIPASNQRALEKIAALDADCYIIDLEDAVAPEEKKNARENLGNFKFKKKCQIVIRINGLDTEWGKDDLKAGCALNPDAILIPKVEKKETIGTVNELMIDVNADQEIKIWAMIETPPGVLNVKKIAKAGKRLTCLVMGTSDLTNELHAQHTKDRMPLLYSLSQTVLAARAEGKSVIDGVHLDLNDEEGYIESCKQGRALGFDGKTLIHPKQIEIANQAFSPSKAEVDGAHKIIKAYQEAITDGKGVVVLDGKLVENLHVENAKRILNMERMIKSGK